MASNGEGYWSRSWALLTRDQGWFKPLLVLAAARMIPIVGALGADGYALEWARLTSWGVDSSPKQRGVDVGGCLKSGARAFVVALGYLFAFGLLRMLLMLVLGEFLGAPISALLGVVAGVLIMVAKLRATIYQSIGAGYQVERIYDMIKRDYAGLLRIAGLAAVTSLALGVVGGILGLAALVPHFGGVVRELIEYEEYGYVDDIYIVASVLGGIAAAMPSLFVLSYLLKVLSSGVSLILNMAVGLWLRQFDVRNWGASSDPLPASVTAAPAEPAYAAQPAAEEGAAAGTEARAAQPAYPQETNPESFVPQEYQMQPVVVPQENAAPVMSEPVQPRADAEPTVDEPQLVEALERAADTEAPFEPAVEEPQLAEAMALAELATDAETPFEPAVVETQPAEALAPAAEEPQQLDETPIDLPVPVENVTQRVEQPQENPAPQAEESLPDETPEIAAPAEESAAQVPTQPDAEEEAKPADM